MTALEMLEALQKKWSTVSTCRTCNGPVHNDAFHRCAYEVQPIIDKLREEQTELVAAIESEPKLELRLFKIRQRLGDAHHATAPEDKGHRDPTAPERCCTDPSCCTDAPEEKHEHTPKGDYCCSCGWTCSPVSSILSEQVISAECARQHAEHVKEQK